MYIVWIVGVSKSNHMQIVCLRCEIHVTVCIQRHTDSTYINLLKQHTYCTTCRVWDIEALFLGIQF